MKCSQKTNSFGKETRLDPAENRKINFNYRMLKRINYSRRINYSNQIVRISASSGGNAINAYNELKNTII